MSLTVLALFVVGLVLLVAGAEVLVKGASRLAAGFRISPLVIDVGGNLHAVGIDPWPVAYPISRLTSPSPAAGWSERVPPSPRRGKAPSACWQTSGSTSRPGCSTSITCSGATSAAAAAVNYA